MTNNHIIHQQPKISHRDRHLLLHMVFMFCIFIGGWGPIYVVITIANYISISLVVIRTLSLLSETSLLCIVVELFVYNRKLRKYLKNIMFKCCGM